MNNRIARIAQIVWVAIALLSAVIFVMGLSVWFPALQQLCTATAQECQQRLQLTPGEAQSLQTSGWSLDAYAWYTLNTRLLQKALGVAIGIVLFWRKPSDFMAWVASIFLMVGSESSIGDALAVSQPAWWLATRVLAYIGSITFALFFYVFPTGKFAPGWTRWTMAIWACVFFITNFFPDSNLSINQSTVLVVLVGLPLFASLAMAQILRYRNLSDATARAQTRWVMVATVVSIAAFFASVSTVLVTAGEARLFHRFWILQDLGFSLLAYLLPIAIAIAILRYRLFDIDVIIRKTLQYGVLSAMLALFYIGSVVLLQTLFGPVMGDSPLLLVLSTLLIAAVFNPLRRRVQDLIDRSFYRKKYDAQQVLARFMLTARDETDLDLLTDRLAQVVQETIEPQQVNVWLRGRFKSGD
jgi:hypothetical protein